jgi:bacterial leucyl aminopeptidase
VRFVLFNAEEHGLVGSQAYARDEAILGTPIVAVFQMDMIGYDVLPEHTFERHAGFTPSPAVKARSLALAQMIAELVPWVSPALPAPLIYPVSGESDPAERRSDHYSFQLQGYTACLASEDLVAGPGSGAPPEEMNPKHHLPTDAVINAGVCGGHRPLGHRRCLGCRHARGFRTIAAGTERKVGLNRHHLSYHAECIGGSAVDWGVAT